MKSDIISDLLHYELRRLSSAEKQLHKALAKMSKAACHPRLQAVLKTRLRHTSDQIGRLDLAASLMKISLAAPRCKVLEQLILEAEDLLPEYADDASFDTALIAAVQHLEHYEIEGYTLARTLASRLGLDEIEAMLQKNLDEEKDTSAKLARLDGTLVYRAYAGRGIRDGKARMQDSFTTAVCLVA